MVQFTISRPKEITAAGSSLSGSVSLRPDQAGMILQVSNLNKKFGIRSVLQRRFISGS